MAKKKKAAPTKKARRRRPRTTTQAPSLPPAPPFRDERITHPTRRAFLAAYADCGNVTRACHAVGISRETQRLWRADPIYAEAFAHAKEHGADSLEEVARLRAISGSDTLLIFLLKGARPEIYRERFEHSGPGGSPLGPSAVVHVSYDPHTNPPETEFEKQRREAEEAAAKKKAKG